MLNTMNRKTRTSSLLVVALALLACLLAGVVRAAPGPALSRHTAITGPVELTMTIEPAVARPRDTVTLDVTLVNRQVQAAAPEVFLRIPPSLSPQAERLPAGTTFNFLDNSLSWMPVLPANGTATLQLTFVASVADLLQPVHEVEAFLRYGDEERSATVELWVGLPPTVSVGASPALVSVGEPVKLTALTTGAGPFVQTWDLGDGRELSATDPEVVYSTPGTYEVTAHVANPLAMASGSTSITVVANPIAAFTVDDDRPVVSQTVQFTDQSGGQRPLLYQWDFGDGKTSREAHPRHQYAEPGIYTVRLVVESEYGMDEASQTITVGAGPVVDFILDDRTGTGQPFYAQAYADESTTRLQWDMGDGSHYEGEVVEHIYYATGDYLVTLRAENDFGASEVTRWVRVDAGNYFSWLPTIFGPLTRTIPTLQLETGTLIQSGGEAIQLTPAPEPVVASPPPQPEPLAPPPGSSETAVEPPTAAPNPAPVGSGAAAEPPAVVGTPVAGAPVALQPQPPLSPNATPAEQLLWYINEARRLHGLAPLAYNYELSVAAQMHTEDLVSNPNIMHEGSDGSRPPERQRRYGYLGIYGGEAVAWGFDNAVPVVEFWVNSPPHRTLILNPNAREVGVGYYADSRAPNIWYWTAEFGIILGSEPEAPAPTPN